MTQVSTQAAAGFTCTQCGKQYRWKPELAGKKVKCKCGGVMHVPVDASTPKPKPAPAPRAPVSKVDDPPEGLAGLYDLASEADNAALQPAALKAAAKVCPNCSVPMQPGAVLCLACGLDVRFGRKIDADASREKVLGYAGAEVARARQRNFNDQNLLWEGSIAKNLYLPLALIVLGAVGWIYVSVTAAREMKLPTAVMAVFFTASLALDVVLIFAALLLGVKLFDMAFGSLWPAVIKIFAIALAPGVIGAISEQVVGNGMVGWFTGMVVTLPLYFALGRLLFGLEMDDAFRFSGMIYFLRRWVREFIFIAFIGLLMSSSSRGGSGSPALPGGRAAAGAGMAIARGPDGHPKLSPEDQLARNIVQLAVKRIQQAGGDAGTRWLEKDKLRIIDNHTRAESFALVRKLEQMQAKAVYLAGPVGDGDVEKSTMIILELPDAKPARAKLIAWGKAFDKEMRRPRAPVPDPAATPEPAAQATSATAEDDTGLGAPPASAAPAAADDTGLGAPVAAPASPPAAAQPSTPLPPLMEDDAIGKSVSPREMVDEVADPSDPDFEFYFNPRRPPIRDVGQQYLVITTSD